VKPAEDQSESHAERVSLVQSDHRTTMAVKTPAVFKAVVAKPE
jgi:hypothetical protein